MGNGVAGRVLARLLNSALARRGDDGMTYEHGTESKRLRPRRHCAAPFAGPLA